MGLGRRDGDARWGARRIPRRRRLFRRRRRPLDRRRVALALLSLVLAGALAVALLLTVFRKPNTFGARVIHFTIVSPRVHAKLTETVIIPAGSSGAGRPLLVFLHGKGGDEDPSGDEPMFAALAKLGARAPDIVFPGGGEDSYWHNRKSGEWGSYVYDEVIPRTLALLHADRRRVAIGGISMGGFGAYDIARLHPRRFCAVGSHSPALWMEGGETPEGAFDNAEDFAANDVIEAAVKSADPYPGAKLWVDVGSEDPFRAADTTFVEVLRAKGRRMSFHVWPGGHEGAYWNSHWGSYLSFYANALAGCHETGRK